MTRNSTQIAQALIGVARNLWWMWNPRAQRLFEALDARSWGSSRHNPMAVLRAVVQAAGQDYETPEETPAGPIAEALGKAGLLEEAAAVCDALDAYLTTDDTWVQREGVDGLAPKTPAAYFSAEFGLSASVPIYSGGLGVLAGDHIKAASDLGLPFVGVGLFYHKGYFEQTLEGDGAQGAVYPRIDLALCPALVVRDDAGAPVTVSLPVGGHTLLAQIRKIAVGRAPLYLLDTNVDGNDERARTITDNLYGGGTDLRIVQEILLGVGGVRALRALGISPAVWHLNEGHCAFLSLELIREQVAKGVDFETAAAAARERSVFTTHTPVPAGHDRFDRDLVQKRFGWMAEALGLSLDALMAYGQVGEVEGGVQLDLPEPGEEGVTQPEQAGDNAAPETAEEAAFSDEPLCMTVMALRLTRAANGVSMVHGEVSRQMWAAMWPDRAASDVPIGHVTNGIHLPTWCSPIARDHLDRHLPEGWQERQDDPELWLDLLDGMSDAEIWAMRSDLKDELVRFVSRRWSLQADRLKGDALPEPTFDPKALTIGFARRFATYKRADLIFHDFERAAALFGDVDRPIQLVFAGKAHPRDTGGQALIASLVEHCRRPELAGRVTILEDYDMVMGRALVSGVDLWLNNPRKPREASGTSGQKVAIHAGLNLSALDGWWPEGFDGVNGFAIGDATPPVSPAAQNDRDSKALYEALENQILPLYYTRGDDGLPHLWIRRVRAAMRTLVGRFTTYRMVKDYTRLFYEPSVR